ncbi:MAG: VOC family protein [Comamonadaceae bacterium]|nr:MAG: VOC family protein [Comamonadaceae bacterium]
MTTRPSRERSPAQVDHLVIAAANLQEGVDWCESVLGVTPLAGGEHPLMGTHNRLLSIVSPAFAQAYLEIIAVQPGAHMSRAAGSRRWFDLDTPELQAAIAGTGPQLVHFVANTGDVRAASRALAGDGLDRGRVVEASRMTPQGLLSWQITIREDGQRLFYGALPTLIQWGDIRPVTGMPASGITLEALHVSHPRPDALVTAYEAVGLSGVTVAQGSPNLIATLQTPRGTVQLESRGI